MARQAVALFETLNREWWASPTEGFIYNEFADAIREGMRIGVLRLDDLMTEDDLMLAKLDASGNKLIAEKLATIRDFSPTSVNGYVPRVAPKVRWLDPLILTGGKPERLSLARR